MGIAYFICASIYFNLGGCLIFRCRQDQLTDTCHGITRMSCLRHLPGDAGSQIPDDWNARIRLGLNSSNISVASDVETVNDIVLCVVCEETFPENLCSKITRY